MGPIRPVIPQLVYKFYDCGNLQGGFARIHCDNSQHDLLLAFSCKSRGFCPACQGKTVQTTAALLAARVFAPVPPRHYVQAIPKMLRGYFQRNRSLRATLDILDAHPAIVLVIHTFGEYLDFHPHLHALVADGPFTRDGVFHPLPELPIKPLEEIFRAHVLKLLVDLELLPPARLKLLLSAFDAY